MDEEDREAVKRVFKDTRVTLHLSDDISDRARNVELPKDLSDFQSHKKERAFGCSKNHPIRRMHVNYDGRVYLCDQDMSLETDFGNVKDNSIKEIWNGKAMIETLKVLYGHAEPGKNSIPCFICASCIDSNKIKILKNSKDYKPRKLLGLSKRMLVKKGLAVVKKRGKLGWIWP
jgi:radical SAM protein with 4Fe4S-binding SPASM domain